MSPRSLSLRLLAAPARQAPARAARAGVVALGLLLAGNASALTLDFDALLSGSAVSAASLPGVSVVDALVLSEADAALLTGFGTAGTWATSGNQGLLNTLQPQIELRFDAPVASFSVDVLGLPDLLGAPTGIRLVAYAGAAVVDTRVSDVGQIGDSGQHEDTLSLAGVSVDRILLEPVVDCPVCAFAPITTSFWIDTVTYESVPEPAAALLLLCALAPIVRNRR